jgi:hypothetical protein
VDTLSEEIRNPYFFGRSSMKVFVVGTLLLLQVFRRIGSTSAAQQEDGTWMLPEWTKPLQEGDRVPEDVTFFTRTRIGVETADDPNPFDWKCTYNPKERRKIIHPSLTHDP